MASLSVLIFAKNCFGLSYRNKPTNLSASARANVSVWSCNGAHYIGEFNQYSISFLISEFLID